MIGPAIGWPGTPVLAWSGVSIFWLLCLFTVLQQVWRGWRQGVGRMLAAALGLILGWVIGNTRGANWTAHLWTGTGRPSSVSVLLGSVLIGIIVYAVIVLAARVLFKRACDHGIGPTRLLLGGLGAFVGIFMGLFGVWILMVGVRLAGSIEQASMPEVAPPSPPATSHPPAGSPPPAPRKAAPVNVLANAAAPVLVRIKQSVETGVVGAAVRVTDPLPPEVYTDLTKVARIAADPYLQMRLLDAPGLKDLALDPKIAALRKDPAVVDALQRHDFLSLTHNPALIAAANDPELARRLRKVDITRVLNETVP